MITYNACRQQKNRVNSEEIIRQGNLFKENVANSQQKNVKGMHLSSNLKASFPVNSSKKATKKEEDEKKRFQFDPTYIPLGRNALSTYLKPAL